MQMFIGTRCRLSRHKDAKFVNGWIQYFRGDSLVVMTDDHMGTAPGDKFFVEAYGPSAKACFEADARLVTGSEGQEESAENESGKITLHVCGHIKTVSNSEPSRTLVNDMTAKVKVAGVDMSAHVRDISDGGLCLITDAEIAVGSELTMQLETVLGPINAKGTVKHTREVQGKFRIGVQFAAFSRLDASRWKKVIGIAA